MSSPAGDYVQGSLSYASLEAASNFNSLEQADISVVQHDSVPDMKEHSLTIHFWTTSPLIRQAAIHKDKLVNEIVLDLICYRLKMCFATDNSEIVINEGSLFTINTN